MCESVAGLCGSGWLHSQECLCHRVRHDRRCASLRLGYVKWVAAQPGGSVLQSQARSSMCESVAGLCGSGWLRSQECLCHRVKTSKRFRHDRRCASLRLGYVGVGGCTARSVCATLAEDGGAAGPGPGLGLSGQAGLDGIVLNVGADGVELFGRADPMVEGFVLPEMLLLQGED